VPNDRPETPNHLSGAAQQNGQLRGVVERVAIGAQCSVDDGDRVLDTKRSVYLIDSKKHYLIQPHKRLIGSDKYSILQIWRKKK